MYTLFDVFIVTLTGGIVLVSGYLAIFLKTCISKNSVEILNQSAELGRKTAYDAVAYATEASAHNLADGIATSEKEKLALAAGYMKNVLNGISEEEAIAYCQSIMAKIPGAGASGKVQVKP